MRKFNKGNKRPYTTYNPLGMDKIKFHKIMNIIKLPYILCFFLLFAVTSSMVQAQTFYYDIYKGEDIIGEIQVKKDLRDNLVHYEANSKSTFRVIFSNEMETRLSADFVNNELVATNSKNTLNGKIRGHSSMQKEGEQLNIFKHPDERIKKKEAPILNSTVLMYFSEPLNLKKVFSEHYLEYCPLTPIGNHTYELVLPGEKINHYVYKNGQLVEIKVFRTFVDLSFRLRQAKS